MILERTYYIFGGSGLLVSRSDLLSLFNIGKASRIEILDYKTRRLETYACVLGEKDGDRIINIEGTQYFMWHPCWDCLYEKHGYDTFYIGVNIL